MALTMPIRSICSAALRLDRRSPKLILAALLLAPLFLACTPAIRQEATEMIPHPTRLSETLQLPEPRLKGTLSLEEALAGRRSLREYADAPLTLEEIGQLLWAAQGITDPAGYRTAPSAGALYPLEVYVVIPEGVYHYAPAGHRLQRCLQGDLRPALFAAALRQEAVLEAPAVFVIAAEYERTAAKYGRERTPRYVHLEAGHAAQNLLLQAEALGLGAVPIGAFIDEQVKEALALPKSFQPLYLIPVGRP
jgi:SagB-type dehydrogenase family enzyme